MTRPKTISDTDLLALARAAFAREGEGMRVRDVATAAGLSEAALFKRFGSKRALIAALFATPPAAFVAPDDLPHGEAGLAALARALLGWLREIVPANLRLVTAKGLAFDTAMARFGVDTMAPTLAEVVAGLARIGATQATPEAAQTLIAAVHSLAVYEVMGAHDGAPMDAAVPALTATLWHGLKDDRQ